VQRERLALLGLERTERFKRLARFERELGIADFGELASGLGSEVRLGLELLRAPRRPRCTG
jgi:hypothetical protein